MPTHVKIVRTNREKLLRELRRLPGIMSGREIKHPELSRSFQTMLGVSLLKRIHEAYQQKSAGGNDNLGNRWKPLSQKTIAARPLAAGEATLYNLPRNRERGILSRQQNAAWRGIFAQTLARLLLQGEAPGPAKVKAAKLAWAVVKSKYGGRTRLETLGKRKVPILVVTKRLIKSLTPGRFNPSTASYSPPPEQLFEVKSGSVKIGTNVPYAKYVHAIRPLWPVKRYSAYGANASMRVWIRDILRNLVQQFTVRLKDWKVDI